MSGRKTPRYSEISSRYQTATDLTDAVLIVEEERFHVSKMLLMISSPVFKKMFSGQFKEAKTSEVTLTGKKAKVIEWLLDYLYPQVKFQLTDEKAAKLLPLSDEYQIDTLRQECVEALMKQEMPRLEIVTLAQKYKLPQLLGKAIEGCALKVRSEKCHFGDSLDEQLKLPENVDISKENLIRIYKEKIKQCRQRLQRDSNKPITPAHYDWL